MVTFSDDEDNPPPHRRPSLHNLGGGDLTGNENVGGGPPQISSMFSYLSSIREERDRENALNPNHPSAGGRNGRRLVTSSSSLWGESGVGLGGGIGGSLPRSLWTKYCLLCTLCGSAATILAGIFLIVAALFRYYTTSINYFESVPTYLPAILVRGNFFGGGGDLWGGNVGKMWDTHEWLNYKSST